MNLRKTGEKKTPGPELCEGCLPKVWLSAQTESGYSLSRARAQGKLPIALERRRDRGKLSSFGSFVVGARGSARWNAIPDRQGGTDKNSPRGSWCSIPSAILKQRITLGIPTASRNAGPATSFSPPPPRSITVFGKGPPTLP